MPRSRPGFEALNPSRTLASAIASARAGAIGHAWDLYSAAIAETGEDDPLALSVKGRLLKDRAARATGEERRRLLMDAAEAYRASAALRPATYPLINAATLSLLAGDETQAQALAQEVLDRIAAAPDEPETPYYRAATRAEALLLLGRDSDARDALGEAMALAPRAWEDHASTLRQFAFLEAQRGGDTAWLDPLRPPRSLHFGGHMSFAPDQPRRELSDEIARLIREEKVGFGYGALAAGADIIVAEALIENGAELHVVLPGGAEAFAGRSVSPIGASWRRRFDALIERAETVHSVRPVGRPPDDAMIAAADDIAMGSALMNAQRLQSEAVQLLILASGEASGASARAQSLWRAGGRPQRILTTYREPGGAEGQPAPAPTERLRPLAVLAVGACPTTDSAVAIGESLERMHAAIARKTKLALPAFVSHDHLILAFEGTAEAVGAAERLMAAAGSGHPLRISGHYGAAASFADPFSGADRPAGTIVPIVEAVLASTPPGTVCVTGDFAAALAIAAPSGPAAGLIGELDAADGGGPIGLYSVSLSAPS